MLAGAGLYGTVAPQTVANFVRTVAEGAYTGTQFSKVLPGQYVLAGRYAPSSCISSTY